MARVKKLHFGDDGKVRNVLLQMPPYRDAVYSINKLYPLEIQATHQGTSVPRDLAESESANTSDSSNSAQKSSTVTQVDDDVSTESSQNTKNMTYTNPSQDIARSTRPARAAAVKQRQLVKDNLLYL